MKYVFSLEKVACIRLAGSLGIIGGCLFLAGICVGLAVSHGNPSGGTSLQDVAVPPIVSGETPNPSGTAMQHAKNENRNNGVERVVVNPVDRTAQQSSVPSPDAVVRTAHVSSSNEQHSEAWVSPPTASGAMPDFLNNGAPMAYTSRTASLDRDSTPYQIPTHAEMKNVNRHAKVSIDETRLDRYQQQKNVVENVRPLLVPPSPPSWSEALPRGPYFLQVGTFLNRSEAQAWEMELRDKGYSTFVVTRRDLKKRIWFQVGIGDFLNRKSAAQAAHQFKEEERLPALIRKKASYLFPAL